MEECCICGCEVYEEDVQWDDDNNPYCPDCAEDYGIASQKDDLQDAA